MPKAKVSQPGGVELAKKAAVELAGNLAVGDYLEQIEEGKGLVTYLFESKQKGYVGWRWSVTLFQQNQKSQITVSEVLMLPGPDSVVAPAWVPWSERLADYRALQAELEAQAALELEEDSIDDADEADEVDEANEVDFPDQDDEPGDEDDGVEPDAESAGTYAADETTSEPEEVKSVEQLTDLAVSNSVESEETQPDTDNTGKKPPRFLRRRKRFGKK